MRFWFNLKTQLTVCRSETSDVCILCNSVESCPLIQALESNLVYPSADRLTITDCPMFERVPME